MLLQGGKVPGSKVPDTLRYVERLENFQDLAVELRQAVAGVDVVMVH